MPLDLDAIRARLDAVDLDRWKLAEVRRLRGDLDAALVLAEARGDLPGEPPHGEHHGDHKEKP